MALLRPRGAALVTLVIDAIHGMVAAPYDMDRVLSRFWANPQSPFKRRVNRL